MRGFNTQFIVTRDSADDPLFAFPLQVAKGTQSTDVRFAKTTPDGGKPKRRWEDEVTGHIFEDKDLRRGVQSPDGEFVAISDEQIASIDAEVAVDGIEVLTTVERSEIPVERIGGFYYLQAPVDGASGKGYRMVYEALCPQPQRGQGKRPKPDLALLVRYQTGSRVKVGVVYSDTEREAMVLVNLVYAHDVREPDEAILAPQQVEVADEVVADVRSMIEGLTDEEVDFDTPADEAISLKAELVDAVAFGGRELDEAEEATVKAPSDGGLLAALEESLTTVA